MLGPWGMPVSAMRSSEKLSLRGMPCSLHSHCILLAASCGSVGRSFNADLKNDL